MSYVEYDCRDTSPEQSKDGGKLTPFRFLRGMLLNQNMQISKEDDHNPIKQDVLNGQPRELADIPPFRGYPCNYGALPQVISSIYNCCLVR